MNRAHLLDLLEKYTPYDADEQIHVQEMHRLVHDHQDAFLRMRAEGHMTASAWLVDVKSKKVVLLHHAKLNRWLQPGGHADGNENLVSVAMKELQEETGLEGFNLYNQGIFDIDIHVIPSRKREKEHRHYDVRFLFIGDSAIQPVKNHESKEVRWVDWKDVSALSGNEKSILRMLEKTAKVFSS